MSHTSTPAAPRRPSAAGMLIGLVPWVLFTLVAAHGTLKAGAIVACAVAAALCVYTASEGRTPKLIELAAVATFAVFTVIAFLADPALTHWLIRYARAIAAGVLCLLVFGSLAVVPFTEEYARESVPRELWNSPHFKALNRQMTIMWGAIFAVMAVSHVIAGAIDNHSGNLVFNWIIPIVLVVAGARRSAAAGRAGSGQRSAS